MKCSHSQKILLISGDYSNIAWESFCNICGYMNSCYVCDGRTYTTERCLRHRHNEESKYTGDLSGKRYRYPKRIS